MNNGNKFVVFDVETPNSQNNRMSAIGICVVAYGQITREFYSLVNPETYFNRFNIELTGITPDMAIGAPCFSELWCEIEPLMSGGILVAHNAAFDMSVLSKCLRAYSITWNQYVPYICTCQMSRRLLPELPSHKLNVVSEYLDIELNHHEAMSDSRAAAEILIRLGTNCNLRYFMRKYDTDNMCTVKQNSI